MAEFASAHDVTTREWNSYGAKSGWSLRLLRGKRTVVRLVPVHRAPVVGFSYCRPRRDPLYLRAMSVTNRRVLSVAALVAVTLVVPTPKAWAQG